jgi:hypothetical protein
VRKTTKKKTYNGIDTKFHAKDDVMRGDATTAQYDSIQRTAAYNKGFRCFQQSMIEVSGQRKGGKATPRVWGFARCRDKEEDERK